MKVNYRMIKRNGKPVRVGYFPETQSLCDCGTLIEKATHRVLSGPGCPTCHFDLVTDESVDGLVLDMFFNEVQDPTEPEDDVIHEADITVEEAMVLFIHDSMDMVDVEDLDPVEDWDMVEEGEIMLELIMSDEEHDPFDSIHLFDVHHPLEPEEKAFVREFGLEMVMVDETNDPADPLADDDVYKSEAPVKTLLRNTGKGADKLLFEDAA